MIETICDNIECINNEKHKCKINPDPRFLNESGDFGDDGYGHCDEYYRGDEEKLNPHQK